MDQNEIFKLISTPSFSEFELDKKPLENEQDLLSKIKKEMQIQERLKYPNPPYETKANKVELDHHEVKVLHVHYDGEKLTTEQLNQMAARSLLVRKLSIIAGILNGFKYSNHYLTSHSTQRLGIEKKLEAIYLEAIASVSTYKKNDEESEMNLFINRITASIKEETGNQNENSIIRQIRNAERYFVAEYNQDQFVVHETKMDDDTIFQIDIPYLNELTDEQKIELITIHGKQPPEWFKNLSTWEQEWLIKVVPKSLEERILWKNFEKMSQSSAMQHIPGIKNARTNYLIKKIKNTQSQNTENNYEVLSSNFKVSTPVPYEMPTKNRLNMTSHSVERVLNRLQKNANSNFNHIWGHLLDSSGLKPIVLMQGLLSDTAFGGDDNTLVVGQARAVKTLSAQNQYNNVQVITGNDPTNFLRFAAAQKGFLSTSYFKRWQHTDQVLSYSKELIDKLNAIDQKGERTLTSEQKNRLQFITLLRTELEKMRNDKYIHRLDRNFQAFKVAYTELLVEAMGGAVSTNCKSGKDRTGLDEIYINSMRLYFDKYQKLPSYGDSILDRQNYIQIFVKLFNSMKTQESAAKNTPGSFGLKDNAGMLCRDIAVALGESYDTSNKRANMNKPKKFQEDEMREKKELTKRELAQKENEIQVFKKQKTKFIMSPFDIIKSFISLAMNKASFKEQSYKTLQKHVIFLQSNNVKEQSDKNIPIGLIANEKSQAVANFAKGKARVLDLMGKLDGYLQAKNGTRQNQAMILYDKLESLNKRIQQVESSMEEYDAEKLGELTKQISLEFEKGIKESYGSWVKRAATSIFRGHSSEYTNMLDHALKNGNRDQPTFKMKR